jgi:hypothetical protein
MNPRREEITTSMSNAAWLEVGSRPLTIGAESASGSGMLEW